MVPPPNCLGNKVAGQFLGGGTIWTYNIVA
jgi:hypothetical protein